MSDVAGWPKEPVYYNTEKETWWFWDETWSHEYGPYNSKEEAEDECVAYAKSL